jgi:hypothetical protein
MIRTRIISIAVVFAATSVVCDGEGVKNDDLLKTLITVYKTAPQGYPNGKDERGIPYAQPDTSVWYRWHFYFDGAIDRAEDAQMKLVADPFNPFEGDGAAPAYGAGVKVEWSAEHAAEGKKTAKVTYLKGASPEKAICAVNRAGGSADACRGWNPGPGAAEKLMAPRLRAPAPTWYAPHYRWVKLDVFNPAEGPVRVRFCNVPIILPAGASVAVAKMADRVGYGDIPDLNQITMQASDTTDDVVLFLGNARVEQEVPAVVSEKGKLFQTMASDLYSWTWPGFTHLAASAKYSRESGVGWVNPAGKASGWVSSWSNRDRDPSLTFGATSKPGCPLRVDLPAGKYGISLFCRPLEISYQSDLKIPASGWTVKVNGKDEQVYPARTPAEIKEQRLAGMDWDWRPGLCVFESLVKPWYAPEVRTIFADSVEGKIELEFPANMGLCALIVFPEGVREEALKEVHRLRFLLAEGWDCSHAWVKGAWAEHEGYLGYHEESSRPETIPDRLKALGLTAADFGRGVVPFARDLETPVFHDTVPLPAEVAAAKQLRRFAVPGETECFNLGLLFLREMKGTRIAVGELKGASGILPAASAAVRVTRPHPHTMQYGHHNHACNWEEFYLIARESVDFYPGAARRIYVDVSVPRDAKPGEYKSAIQLSDNDGKMLTEIPLVLEVLPIELKEPDVFLATGLVHPEIKNCGFNTFACDYDKATQGGFRGCLPGMGGKFRGKGLDPANKDVLAPIFADGKAGKGPRVFFGDSDNGSQIKKETVEPLFNAFPDLDFFVYRIPIFAQPLSMSNWTHDWIPIGKPSAARPEDMQAARQAGKEFWFLDRLKAPKDQFARFTFGFWLWRSGASGRFTPLGGWTGVGVPLGGEVFPYHNHISIIGDNVYAGLLPGKKDGEWSMSRDLVLLREGIDDYRYVRTLELLAKAAKVTKPEATAAAEKFLEELCASLSLDLKTYYRWREGSFAENYYPLQDNPWTGAKLDETRRKCAEYILALETK